MILRVSFANITPRELAERIQAAGLSGSVFESLGAGAWGIEPGATAEFAFRADAGAVENPHRLFTLALLRERNEQAAYLTVADSDGTRAFLWWADGRPAERLD